MAKKDEFKQTLSQLGDKLKTQEPTTPLQMVSPVEPEKVNQASKPAHVNFWVPDQLMERLKIFAVKNKTTIKQIGAEALEEYLDKRK